MADFISVQEAFKTAAQYGKDYTDKKVNPLAEEIAVVSRAVDEKIAPIAREVDSLGDVVAKNTADITEQKDAVDKINEELVDIKYDVSAQTTRIGELYQEVEKATGKVDSMATDVGVLKSNKADKTYVDAEVKKVDDKYKAEIRRVDGKIDSTKAEVDTELVDLKEEIAQVVDLIPVENSEVALDIEKTYSTGKAIYFNSQYNLSAFKNEASYFVKAYKVYAGHTYKVVATVGSNKGGDGENPIGAICNTIMNDESTTSRLLQPIITDTVVPMTRDLTIYVSPTLDGYMYINRPISVTENSIQYKTFKDRGIYVNGDKYTHFTKVANGKYICREFKNVFVNNLLQLYKMYIGHIENDSIVEDITIGTSNSDVVGPLSIHRGDVDSWIGKWSGGGHGVSIGGVEYPTAKQESAVITCDSLPVTSDGLYFGNVTIKTKNNLYYPHTVTGSDLSNATLALNEYRTYKLTDKMVVDVRLECGETSGYVNAYYGCQCNTYDMENSYLPTEEKVVLLNGMTSSVVFSKANREYFCSNGNRHYNVKLLDYGIGDFRYNDGSEASLGYGNVATFKKIYQQLVVKNKMRISPNKVYCWGAEYDYYLD